MLLADNAPELRDPSDVRPVRDIVPDPQEEDADKGQHKGPRQVVMGIFCTGQKHGICLFANQRGNIVTAIFHQQPREAEDDETARKHPVGKPFKRLEPRDRAARLWLIQRYPTAQQEEQGKRSDGAQQQIGPEPGHWPFAVLPPFHATILHQHTGHIAPGRNLNSVMTIAQRAPHLRVTGTAKGAKLIGHARRRIFDVRIPTWGNRQTFLAAHDVIEGLRAPCCGAVCFGGRRVLCSSGKG